MNFASGPLKLWVLTSFGFYAGDLLLAAKTGEWPLHAIWSMISYCFLHLDWLHLLVNVGFFLAFGSLVERSFGPWRFLVIFAACAVGAPDVPHKMSDGGQRRELLRVTKSENANYVG